MCITFLCITIVLPTKICVLPQNCDTRQVNVWTEPPEESSQPASSYFPATPPPPHTHLLGGFKPAAFLQPFCCPRGAKEIPCPHHPVVPHGRPRQRHLLRPAQPALLRRGHRGRGLHPRAAVHPGEGGRREGGHHQRAPPCRRQRCARPEPDPTWPDLTRPDLTQPY